MKQGLILTVGFALILVIIAAVIIFARRWSVAYNGTLNLNTATSGSASAADGLQSTDITVGTGAEAVSGKTVIVNYTGTLTDGTKFDSSYDRNQPFSFGLGNHEVIAGWDQGVVGMKVGGKRHLVIPPSLGYGAQANGKIPANSTLVFDIELLGVQ